MPLVHDISSDLQIFMKSVSMLVEAIPEGYFQTKKLSHYTESLNVADIVKPYPFIPIPA